MRLGRLDVGGGRPPVGELARIEEVEGSTSSISSK
jgi:hypothetical protein